MLAKRILCTGELCFLEFSHLMTHPVEMKENTTTAAADAENTTTTDERCSRQINQIR